MRVNGLAVGIAQGNLEHRIELDRSLDAALQLRRVTGYFIAAKEEFRLVARWCRPPWGTARRRRNRRPVKLDASLGRTRLGATAFGPGHHNDVVAPGLDIQTAAIGHTLHIIAAERGEAGLCVGRTDALCHDTGGVVVRPHASNHTYRIGCREDGGVTAVYAGLAYVKAGVSPGELLDFVLGIVGLDIAGDDGRQ